MSNFQIRRFTLAIIALLSMATVLDCRAQTSGQGALPTIALSLNGADLGRKFEGLGAVSGGGNSSRLLPDYADPEKKQILDYLFQPMFGASLTDLKVEVGGDVNSTQGSEPSHMHLRDDQNYSRGFEWWLMKQAQTRNPAINLDCLAWGAPGWVGNGNFWSDDMMNYYIQFIKGAKRDYGLNIGSVGGKNESGYNKDWYIRFRKALNASGLSNVKLVGSDDWGPNWLNLANDTLTNPALAKAVNAFAGHVTWSENPTVPSQAILATGKPLWDTELHNYLPGFDAEISLIHAINENYIKAKITKNLTWYLTWSTYPESSYPDVGLIRANSPWSGHYEVLPVLWGFAHVNQFVRLGWRFLEDDGNGYLPGGGTYTTLASPDSSNYTVIAETKGAKGSQPVQFHLSGGLPSKTVHIWTSTVDEQFIHAADVTPVHGLFSVTLEPNTVYTISTTTGQHKGEYPSSPANAPFPFPYTDNYQEYRLNAQPRYHFDYEGAFEIQNRRDGKGKCLRQDATKSASGWGIAFQPLTFLGSGKWTNYSVSVDVYIENAGAVSLHGRIKSPGDGKDDPEGYTFRIHDNGTWELKSYKSVIAHGNSLFAANQWHHLKMNFDGTAITAFVDGKQVTSVNDTTYSEGLVGLGTGWNFAEFDDLSIQPG